MRQKIKNIIIYLLVGIGVVAIVIVVFNVLGSLNSARKSSLKDTNFGQGLFPSFSVSPNFSGTDSAPFSSKGNQPAQLAEGQLTQRKIVKNGTFSFLVKSAEESADKIKNIAEGLGGFVSDSRVYEVSSGTKTGTVTIRVPASSFNETVAELKKLAVKVENEHVSTQDITEQFVDLEARLKNLQAEEAQYVQIIKQSYSVQDTLSVAQRLSDVRGRIESIQGQIQYLARQVDMSSITISLTSEADIEVFGIRWRPLFVIKQSFRSMLSGLTGYANTMIAFIFQLPVIILWLATVAILGVVAWKMITWLRKFFSVQPPAV